MVRIIMLSLIQLSELMWSKEMVSVIPFICTVTMQFHVVAVGYGPYNGLLGEF